ncbi:MAG: hypothetical protein ABFD16_16490 [Thermoguttaceae bacterium]|jgi:hypothetical protein
MKPTILPHFILLTLLLSILVGCGEDARVVQVAREAADRQAEQNRQIAYQNQQLAGATQSLVEAGAQARKELVSLQKDLQAQQAEIGHQRDQLEADRRQVASDRTWDSQVALAAKGLGVLAACLVPLLLCWQLLHAVKHENDDSVLTEVLITEITSPESPLLSRSGDPPALPGDRKRLQESPSALLEDEGQRGPGSVDPGR